MAQEWMLGCCHWHMKTAAPLQICWASCLHTQYTSWASHGNSHLLRHSTCTTSGCKYLADKHTLLGLAASRGRFPTEGGGQGSQSSCRQCCCSADRHRAHVGVRHRAAWIVQLRAVKDGMATHASHPSAHLHLNRLAC